MEGLFDCFILGGGSLSDFPLDGIILNCATAVSLCLYRTSSPASKRDALRGRRISYNAAQL